MRRLRFWLLYPLFLLLLVELACRAFWTVSGASFLDAPNTLHRYFYPELAEVAADPPRDGRLDVLLLGGSVLDPRFNDVGAKLEKRLADAVGEARVHCVARPSQTSRDSLFKYRRLKGHGFDVAVFYHGINEARANNCPPEMFRIDYSHWGWYRLINAYEEGGKRWLVLPYTLEFVWTKLGGKLGMIPLVPKHRPGPEWIAYGGDVKTAAALRANLEACCEIARAKQHPLLVMTFASYLARGYTREKFAAGELDYADPELPVELWGEPEHVMKALAAHNDVVREVAARHRHVYLVDQARELPANGRFFNDVCHLSPAGAEKFAENLFRGIVRAKVARMR